MSVGIFRMALQEDAHHERNRAFDLCVDYTELAEQSKTSPKGPITKLSLGLEE